jgi:hypothetical protein
MIKFLLLLFLLSSCSPQITAPQNKELSIVYPDPTYNNLLISQE